MMSYAKREPSRIPGGVDRVETDIAIAIGPGWRLEEAGEVTSTAQPAPRIFVYRVSARGSPAHFVVVWSWSNLWYSFECQRDEATAPTPEAAAGLALASEAEDA